MASAPKSPADTLAELHEKDALGFVAAVWRWTKIFFLCSVTRVLWRVPEWVETWLATR